MLDDYITYHIKSSKAKDIDPSNDALRYISDRFELNIEQRYWLAFLYATCYSATTVYYIYNEFPDYENVNVDRLNLWWESNKNKTLFQTDRLRIKTQNKFVESFISYKELLNGMTQSMYFNSLKQNTKHNTYNNLYINLLQIKNFGRFTMFLYIEMINVLTKYDTEPDFLDLKRANNCREGLMYHLIKTKKISHIKKKLSDNDIKYLQYEFRNLHESIKELNIEHDNIWNIETTLCAYKKYNHNKRYVGYYIERMKKEIIKMSTNVNNGVDWSVMWDFRQETYHEKWLTE